MYHVFGLCLPKKHIAALNAVIGLQKRLKKSYPNSQIDLLHFIKLCPPFKQVYPLFLEGNDMTVKQRIIVYYHCAPVKIIGDIWVKQLSSKIKTMKQSA